MLKRRPLLLLLVPALLAGANLVHPGTVDDLVLSGATVVFTLVFCVMADRPDARRS